MPAQPLTEEQKADAERLRFLFKKWQATRKDNRLPASQAEAAELLGLGFGQSAFSQYLRGDIPLNVRVVAAFAGLLECLPEEISPTLAAELHALASAGSSANHNSASADMPISGPNGRQTVKSQYDVASNMSDGPAASQGPHLAGGRASVSARPIAAWDREEELGDEYVFRG